MNLIKYYILIFFVNLCFANTTTDPVVTTAIDQLNYLSAVNSNSTNDNNNWYIYFLNKDLDYLKKVLTNKRDLYENIHTDNLPIDSNYLTKLNEQLIELNKSKIVDVYVAFTGADNRITIPIIPTGKTNLEEKINYIDSLVLLGTKSTKEREQLLESKIDLEKYNTYLQKKIQEIYEGSNLAKNSTAPNIIMPFSNQSLRYVYDENGKTKGKYFWAYSLYLGKTERRFNHKAYKDFFNNETENKAFGPSDHYKRVSKQVIALANYFSSNVPLLEDYKEDCSALLKAPQYAPLLESQILRNTIINNPCVLKGMVPMGPFDTSKSQWVKDTELFIVAPLYVAILAPVTAEFFIPAAIEAVGTERASNASIAMAAAVMIESVQLHYWTGNNEQKNNWGKAVLGINKINVLYEGAKGLAQLPLPTELITDCAYNGAQIDKLISDPKNYNFDWHTKKCFFGAAISVAARYGLNQGGSFFKTLTNLAKENPKLFITGWKRVLNDIKVDQADSFKILNSTLKKQFEDLSFSPEKISLFKDFISGKKPIQTLDDAIDQLDNSIDNANNLDDVTTNNKINTPKEGNTSADTPIVQSIINRVSLTLNDIKISQTGLIKNGDGTFKLRFTTKKEISSLDTFLKTTTKNRKNFIKNLQHNPKAKVTLETNLADISKGTEITISEIEISTTLADGSVKNNSFKIESINKINDEINLLKLIKEGSEVLTQKINELDKLKGKFMEDLVAMKDDIAKFVENPDLVDSWKALKDSPFRTDVKWLESFDILKRNNVLRYARQASDVELTAIHKYTVNNFDLTRNAYLNRLSQKQNDWIAEINSGLDKLRSTRKFEGKVFRGSNRPESEIIEKYVRKFDEGKARGITPRVNEPPLLSTSKNSEIAEDFIEKFKSPENVEVMFEINSKRGVDIDDISNYGKNLCSKNPKCDKIQQEVILSNNQDYEILDVVKTNKSDGSTRYLIKLNE